MLFTSPSSDFTFLETVARSLVLALVLRIRSCASPTSTLGQEFTNY